MNFEPLEFTTAWKHFKSERVHMLCVMNLPQEVQDKTGRAELIKTHGSFLLGFSLMPVVGEVYPYEGNLWMLIKQPLQFPHRYQSQQEKQPAIALFKWIGRYSVEDFIQDYIED